MDFEQFLKKNKKLVTFSMKNYWSTMKGLRLSYSEMKSLIELSMWEAFEYYEKSDKKYKFTSFLNKRILNNLSEESSFRNKGCSYLINETELEDSKDFVEEIEDQEIAKIILAHLTYEERSLLKQRFSDQMTLQKISENNNSYAMSISYKQQKILEKCRIKYRQLV